MKKCISVESLSVACHVPNNEYSFQSLIIIIIIINNYNNYPNNPKKIMN